MYCNTFQPITMESDVQSNGSEVEWPVCGHQVIDELGVHIILGSLGLQHIHGWEGSPRYMFLLSTNAVGHLCIWFGLRQNQMWTLFHCLPKPHPTKAPRYVNQFLVGALLPFLLYIHISYLGLIV